MVITVYSDRRSSVVARIASRLSLALARVTGVRRVALLADDLSPVARPAGVALHELVAVDDAGFQALVAQVRGHHDVTVIAPAEGRTEHAFLALELADRVLLLSDLTVAGIRGVQRILKLCASLGYPYEKPHVVLYHSNGEAQFSPDEAAAVLKREVYGRVPSLDHAMAERSFDELAYKLLRERLSLAAGSG